MVFSPLVMRIFARFWLFSVESHRPVLRDCTGKRRLPLQPGIADHGAGSGVPGRQRNTFPIVRLVIKIFQILEFFHGRFAPGHPVHIYLDKFPKEL